MSETRERELAIEHLAAAHERAKKPLVALDLRTGNLGKMGVRWVETSTALDALEALSASTQVDGLREALEAIREPTDAMIDAAASTPGMKACNDAMMLHQARGLGFNGDAFKGGSPLHQAWRAMIDAALASLPHGGEATSPAA